MARTRVTSAAVVAERARYPAPLDESAVPAGVPGAVARSTEGVPHAPPSYTRAEVIVLAPEAPCHATAKPPAAAATEGDVGCAAFATRVGAGSAAPGPIEA